MRAAVLREIYVCTGMQLRQVADAAIDGSLADALTKGVDAAAKPQHLEGARIELRCDRHQIAPDLRTKEDQT